jgi:hypothetical protein
MCASFADAVYVCVLFVVDFAASRVSTHNTVISELQSTRNPLFATTAMAHAGGSSWSGPSPVTAPSTASEACTSTWDSSLGSHEPTANANAVTDLITSQFESVLSQGASLQTAIAAVHQLFAQQEQRIAQLVKQIHQLSGDRDYAGQRAAVSIISTPNTHAHASHGMTACL